MPATAHNLNTVWQKIVSIEPAGVEHVYDLTVEDLHSFVANGIIVHNCVYQEQVIQILTDIAGYSAGEADLVRRGISKKARKVLDEHREVFAQGSARVSNLTRGEADTIWDALMGFARYGFNRAHAADYAVIVAQTAFMKAMYPAEYMAALLTIERHDTEKVGVLIAECRRMGLEVLPPDINVSSNGFTIEQLPPSRAALRQLTTYRFPLPEGMAIRMGLDAIKNVGEGAIELILKARGDRAFASLEEFADRTDLRQVNRRVLECLVKVGALDCWGPREKLLAAIDRIIGRSASAYEAAEIGQMSLFGGPDDTSQDSGGLLENMNGIKPLNAKETLEWEKELVGVYVSAHPLQRMTVDLAQVVTHQCIDITEEIAKTPVVIAGMITDVRTITTKKGDTMAFVRLEDLQGATEITVFPSVLKETRALWVPEKIVIVRGKVDARNGRAGIIAEGVQDYVEGRAVIDDTTSVHYRYHNGQLPSRPQTRHRVDPEEGPYDLDEENGAATDDANPFAGEQPGWEDGDPAAAVEQPAPPPAARAVRNGHPAAYSAAKEGTKSAVTPPGRTSGKPEQKGKPAPAPAPAEEPSAPRLLRIPFSRSSSIEDDRRRLGQLLAILGRYPGEDGFQVVVEASDGMRYELDFPNIRIDVCPQLEAEISQWRGSN